MATLHETEKTSAPSVPISFRSRGWRPPSGATRTSTKSAWSDGGSMRGNLRTIGSMLGGRATVRAAGEIGLCFRNAKKQGK